MTSRPTTKPDPARRAAGFTLVELLLVLTLAVLLAALATPSLTGTLARVRLDSAAEAVRTAWTDARLEAIRTGQPVAFQCQLGTGVYSLSTLDNAAAALAGSTEVADQEELSSDEDGDLGAVTFVQCTVGDTADDPTTGAMIDTTVAACVVFHPDGATDDAVAVIQAADGRQRRITLRGLTGSASVEVASASEAM